MNQDSKIPDKIQIISIIKKQEKQKILDNEIFDSQFGRHQPNINRWIHQTKFGRHNPNYFEIECWHWSNREQAIIKTLICEASANEEDYKFNIIFNVHIINNETLEFDCSSGHWTLRRVATPFSDMQRPTNIPKEAQRRGFSKIDVNDWIRSTSFQGEETYEVRCSCFQGQERTKKIAINSHNFNEFKDITHIKEVDDNKIAFDNPEGHWIIRRISHDWEKYWKKENEWFEDSWGDEYLNDSIKDILNLWEDQDEAERTEIQRKRIKCPKIKRARNRL